MHEYRHGELKSGARGKGGRVKNSRQAVAIALKEAGASKYETKRENQKNLAKSKRKKARGQTSQQEAEGKSRGGPRRLRGNSPAKGVKKTSRRRADAQGRNETTKAALYARAKAKGLQGRSTMTKRQLQNALARR